MYRLGLLHSGLFLQCLTHSWCSESICPLPIFVDYGFIISLFHEFHEGGDLLLTVFLPQNSVNKIIHSLPVQLDVTVCPIILGMSSCVVYQRTVILNKAAVEDIMLQRL